MPFMVRGFFNSNPLTLTSETAKEAFAKAIEWHIVESFTDVSISDGVKDYTISEFASLMALREIDQTMSRNDKAISNIPSAGSPAASNARRLDADP